MPFKIVQTMERGMLQLSIIPASWEANGQLYWPPKNIKNKGMLIRDKRSMPSLNWDVLECTVKRNNYSSYEEAEAEMNIMQENTDTDSDVNDLMIKHKQHRVTAQSQCDVINYDELAENLTNIQETAFDHHKTQETTNAPEETAIVHMYNIDHIDQILSNQTLILEKVQNMSTSIENLISNQKNIAQKLAVLSVQQDELAERIIVERMQQSVTMLKDANTSNENENFIFKPIEDQNQLVSFEILLSNNAKRLKVKKQLSFLCSTAEGNGQSCAYKLLDILMSRAFLCKCSWSGGSRGQVSKVPLKNYKLFINFFSEMVHSWDSSFTVEKTEQFMKLVLKNALKRSTMKNLRSSTKRRRQTEKENTINSPLEIIESRLGDSNEQISNDLC